MQRMVTPTIAQQLTLIEQEDSIFKETTIRKVDRCLVRTVCQASSAAILPPAMGWPTTENIWTFMHYSSFVILCRIAYCYVYEDKKIEKVELFNEFACYSMSTEEDLDLMGLATLSDDSSIEFLHPTVMEFLAAVYLSQCSADDITNFVEQVSSGCVLDRWKVLRFLFYQFNANGFVPPETKLLFPHVVKCLCESVVCTSDGFVNDTAFLDVLRCLYESQDALTALDTVVLDKTLVFTTEVTEKCLPALAYYLAKASTASCSQKWRVFSSDQALALRLVELVEKLEGSILVSNLCGLPSTDGGVLYITRLSLSNLQQSLLTTAEVDDDLALHSDSCVLRVHSGVACLQSFSEAFHHSEASSEDVELPFPQPENPLPVNMSQEESNAMNGQRRDEMVVPRVLQHAAIDIETDDLVFGSGKKVKASVAFKWMSTCLQDVTSCPTIQRQATVLLSRESSINLSVPAGDELVVEEAEEVEEEVSWLTQSEDETSAPEVEHLSISNCVAGMFMRLPKDGDGDSPAQRAERQIRGYRNKSPGSCLYSHKDFLHLVGGQTYPTCRFSSGQLLGKGAYGCVSKVRFGAEVVAVKKTKFRENELVILSKLDHKNVIQILAVVVGEMNGFEFSVYQIFRCYDGDLARVTRSFERYCLRSLMRKCFATDLAKLERIESNFCYIAHEVLSALDYLHTRPRPIVHRDVKPENILVKMHCACENPLTCTCLAKADIVLSDFDASLKLSDNGTMLPDGESSQGKVYHATRRGTFGYIAPEGFMNTTGNDPAMLTTKLDIFSFGVLMLLLLLNKQGPKSQLCEAVLMLGQCQISKEEGAQASPRLPFHVPEENLQSILPCQQLRQTFSHRPSLCDFVEDALKIDPQERPSAAQLLDSPYIRE